MSVFAKLRAAWDQRDALGDANRERDLAAFLPAALEIQETPPNPLARWLAWGLLILVIVVLMWALFGSVNIVASAEGKIIPSSRVKQVQPLEKGIVKKLLVREGEYVNKDQPLIELDTTLTQADKKKLASELQNAKMRLMVNQKFLALVEQSDKSEVGAGDFALYSEQDVQNLYGDVSVFNNLLRQQWLQYQSQHLALQGGLAKSQAQQGAAKEIIKKLEQTLPIVEQRAAKLKSLMGKDFVSEIDYLAAEQERIQQAQDLSAKRQNLKELQAAETEIKEQINLHRAQAAGEKLSEVSELQRHIAALEEEFVKAKDLDEKQILYAPVAGRIQELAVSTVGGVVTAAQQLMIIVPDEEHLEAEVYLENKDIGFVREDMAAEIKVHTFPFTKYGIIDAQITNVSDDATADEQKGLIYRMQLRMARNTLWVGGKEVRLQPGMVVTAEVQTGRRRIIEFFLAPLLRYGQESMRER